MAQSQFSQNFKAWRINRGWTQEVMARFINATAKNIGSWEEDRAFPQAEKLIEILQKMKIKNVYAFFFGKSEETKKAEIDFMTQYEIAPPNVKKAIDTLLEIE